jgi:hypothetical protein
MKLVTKYFQVPTRLATVTRQTGEYKVVVSLTALLELSHSL